MEKMSQADMLHSMGEAQYERERIAREKQDHEWTGRVIKELQAHIKFYQDQERARGWKDAKEPPDSDVTVLVFCPEDAETVRLGFYDGEDWRSIESVLLPEQVTHWMDTPELPEPPQPED